MTNKTAALGKNAFEGNLEVFLPVEIDAEKAPLRQRGKEEGLNNFPGPQAAQPSATEQDVIRKVAQTAEQTHAGLSQHFSGFHALLTPSVKTWDPEALKGTIRSIPNEMKENLDSKLREFRSKSAITGPEWRNARESYEKFRERNELTLRPADYLSAGRIVLWFVFLILAEAVLNATLLWELTGFLLAFGQTTLITMVNVVFGAGLAGLFFRYKNHVSWGKRLLVAVSPAALLGILGFNVAVAHYRDALVAAKIKLEQLEAPVNWDNPVVESIDARVTDYTAEAFESFLAAPLDIDSILSALLIVVGVGFFGFATYKWYSMWDPYPGYRKRDQDLKKKHRLYGSLLEKSRAEIERQIRKDQDRVFYEKTKVTDMRLEHSSLTDRARTLRTSYGQWVAVLEKNQNALLALYRDSNKQARTEEPPDYFNALVSIDDRFAEAPEFAPPDLQNAEEVLRTVNEAEARSREIAEDVWRQFDAFADMEHEVGRNAAGQLEARQTETGQTETGQTETGQTEAGQTEAGQTEAGQTEAGQTEAGQTEAGQTEAGQTEAGRREAG